MPVLVLAFALAALLYASAGFGGGSAYSAILVLGKTDYTILPAVTLACNLIVVTGGTVSHARKGLIRRDLILPFAALSVPMAWLGGRLQVDQATFSLLLGVALILVGAMLLTQQVDTKPDRPAARRTLWGLGLPVGAGLGLLAGIVGIGGGIFLAPIMHMLRLADTRAIAATASFFILVNSAAGLLGQVAKTGVAEQLLSEFLPLFLAVFIGGQVGSYLGNSVLSPVVIQRVTAVLVIVAAVRLLYTWLLLPAY